MPVRLYFSNSVESLAKRFAHDIIAVPRWPDPLTVLAPNPYLQKWLFLETTRINGISMNLRFRLLNDGLWELLGKNASDGQFISQLDQNDIRLFLCHALKKIFPGPNDNDPLSRYLFDTNCNRKTDYEQRLWQLSIRLSRHFQDYEMYRVDLINAWLNGSLLYNTPMEIAQRNLYLSIFGSKGFCTTAAKTAMTLPQYWRYYLAGDALSSGATLFLFGETRLSPLHAAIIYELGKTNEIAIYQVNPCAEFWEDVSTPGEDRWQRIRSLSIETRDEGESLLENENENPLLKYWGKTGRETVKILSLLEDAGSRDCNLITEWIDPEPLNDQATCLSLVQRQIHDRFSEMGAIDRIPQDTSIQIASCPDLYREVEAVYQSIVYNLSHDDDLLMTDIAVMVPDMSLYGPVIESVFSRDPRRISFAMIDTTAVTDSIFGSGIRSILSIASGNFSRRELFDLFYNQCFLNAQSLTSHDIDVWLSWTDSLCIFREFVTSDSLNQEDNPFTWIQGLRRLRFGRIMVPSASEDDRFFFPDFLGIVPYTDMYTSDRDLLEAFNVTVELLHAKTASLRHLRAPGSEWFRLLSDICEEFLSIPPSLPEESIARFYLMESLQRLSLVDQISDPDGEGLSLDFLRAYIDEHLASIPSSRGNYLIGGVNVSALIPNRQIPFALIYILGMQEGVFPGNADASTLNLMTIQRKLGDATRVDLNRYLFLETLISARKKIYITYVSRDLRKDQSFHPNSTLSQLLYYLNNYVVSEPFFVPQIPPSGDSEEYLCAWSAIKSGSDIIASFINGNYQPALYNETDRILSLGKAFLHNASPITFHDIIKKKITALIPNFQIPPENDSIVKEKSQISFRDLYYFLLNPAESTLRWNLSLHDEDEEDLSAIETEPFYSSPRFHYKFVTDILHHYIRRGGDLDLRSCIKSYYRHLRLKSNTPDGAFAHIDLDYLCNAIIERIDSENGLASFLNARRDVTLINDVSIGSTFLPGGTDLPLPPLKIQLDNDPRNRCVELHGSLPALWLNKDSGLVESLVITNSKLPAPVNVMISFLFFAAVASGLSEELTRAIGVGPYIVHVSTRTGISSYPYENLIASDCTDYLFRLLSDFLAPDDFDLLPLAIITNPKIIQPTQMIVHPEEKDRERYCETLTRLIIEDSDKLFPSFRPMKLLDLLELRVPTDAYDKARDRLSMPLKPFAGDLPA